MSCNLTLLVLYHLPYSNWQPEYRKNNKASVGGNKGPKSKKMCLCNIWMVPKENLLDFQKTCFPICWMAFVQVRSHISFAPLRKQWSCLFSKIKLFNVYRVGFEEKKYFYVKELLREGLTFVSLEIYSRIDLLFGIFWASKQDRFNTMSQFSSVSKDWKLDYLKKFLRHDFY